MYLTSISIPHSEVHNFKYLFWSPSTYFVPMIVLVFTSAKRSLHIFHQHWLFIHSDKSGVSVRWPRASNSAPWLQATCCNTKSTFSHILEVFFLQLVVWHSCSSWPRRGDSRGQVSSPRHARQVGLHWTSQLASRGHASLLRLYALHGIMRTI